jgi:hypothetical protein
VTIIAPPAAAATATVAAPAAIAVLVRPLRARMASETGQINLVWIRRCSGCMARPTRPIALRAASLPRHRTRSSKPQMASRMVQLASSGETRMFTPDLVVQAGTKPDTD